MGFVNLYLKLGLTAVIIITIGNANPFLYNPSRALPLVATSSSTPQQSSNIADLRESKIEQFSKLQASEDEDQSFFDNGTNGSTPNQVIQGIVQKKIAKIFAKLQILSTLSNNNNYGYNDNTDEQSITAFNDGESFLVTTNNSVLSKGNFSAEQFEQLKNAEDVGRQLNFMPITLRRIFESVVNLTYRMLSSTAAKVTVPDSH